VPGRKKHPDAGQYLALSIDEGDLPADFLQCLPCKRDEPLRRFGERALRGLERPLALREIVTRLSEHRTIRAVQRAANVVGVGVRDQGHVGEKVLSG
jgi:hypothetical protein